MDKDLLRLVIIASGAVVFVIVLLWGLYKGRSHRSPFKKRNPLDHIDNSLVVNMSEDEFDIVPLGSALDNDNDFVTPETRQETYEPDSAPDSDLFDAELYDDLQVYQDDPETTVKSTPEPAEKIRKIPSEDLPELVQFSLLSNDEHGFNGVDLVAALKNAGLVYGDLKIFEQLDDQNRVDFGVASMVNPGTFPDHDLHLFFCPGITFFMQPQVLDQPLSVLDTLLELIYHLSAQLNGEILNAQRQPLTEQNIDIMRQTFGA